MSSDHQANMEQFLRYQIGLGAKLLKDTNDLAFIALNAALETAQVFSTMAFGMIENFTGVTRGQ